VEYVPLGKKNQKELQILRTAMLLKSTSSFSGMAVPQFEVLCQAFFQESGKRREK
jgi:hypothetical protein